MIAITAGLEVIGCHHEVDATSLAAELRNGVPGTVAAADCLHLRNRGLRTVFGEYCDHATRRVTVKGRERPAQDLDALR